MIVKRGDVYYADLGIAVGCEQGGKRPVIIISNNIGNRFSPVVKVVPITAQIQKAKLPTHVFLRADVTGLDRDSVAMCEQTRTIDKSRLIRYETTLDELTMKKINYAEDISKADDETFFQIRNELVSV